jgi:transketolase
VTALAEKIATRDAYGDALAQLGEGNEKIVVLDADLSKSTKTAVFGKKFPERFFNIGISEADMMGTAAGMAAAGKIPFASTFAVFATGRAYDQIRNSIAYPGLNVKIAATHAGLTVGEDGGSHQAVEDIAIMRAIPGMTVLVPSDGVSTKKLVAAAAEYVGPVYLRLGRPAVPVIYNEDEEFVIGRAKELRAGSDLTLVAAGIMVAKALEAAEGLAKEGINVRVLDMHTIKPLDGEALNKAAQETGVIITVEEHSVLGGLGGAVAEFVAENCPVPVIRLGVQDTFGESGKPDELLVKYGLTVEKIVEAVKRLKNDQ